MNFARLFVILNFICSIVRFECVHLRAHVHECVQCMRYQRIVAHTPYVIYCNSLLQTYMFTTIQNIVLKGILLHREILVLQYYVTICIDKYTYRYNVDVNLYGYIAFVKYHSINCSCFSTIFSVSSFACLQPIRCVYFLFKVVRFG